MKYKLCNGVTVENIDGQSILITGKSDAAVLNETSAFLLHALLDGLNVKQAADCLAGNYAVDFETALSDVQIFINDMTDKNLLEQMKAI